MTKVNNKERKTKCICCDGKGYVISKVPRNFTLDHKKTILKLYKEGWGVRQIARKFEMQAGSVSYILKNINKTLYENK